MPKTRSWRAEGWSGKGVILESHDGESGSSNTLHVPSLKQAREMADALNAAYAAGRQDLLDNTNPIVEIGKRVVVHPLPSLMIPLPDPWHGKVKANDQVTIRNGQPFGWYIVNRDNDTRDWEVLSMCVTLEEGHQQ